MPSSQIPGPEVLAMVVCDAVWRDPATGKAFVLGVFHNIMAREFPATHAFLSVFCVLTDGRGQMPITLKLVSSDEATIVHEQKITAEFPDPRATVELASAIQNLRFPQAGEYRFQLFYHNELLIERKLVLLGVE